MNKRVEKLRGCILKNALDCALVTDENNVRYFSGFTGEGYLVISQNSAVLATDFRYVEQAKIQSVEFEIADVAKVSRKEILSKFTKVGFENKTISYSDYLSFSNAECTLVPMNFALTDMRAIKDEEEISLIKKAEHIGDLAFEHILKFLKPGVCERDIALELEFFMRKNGAEAMSFPPITASGKNGAMPHAEPSDRVLTNGDLVVMDFGCKYEGYCSDMTRTVCIGKANKEQRDVYYTVLKAQKEAIAMLCEGARASEAHFTALGIIEEKYPDTFGHALGHGVGLEIHERPVLSPKSDTNLSNGHVVTVEPGIYLPEKFGVRIEDVVVINSKSTVNLTNSAKDLIEL